SEAIGAIARRESRPLRADLPRSIPDAAPSSAAQDQTPANVRAPQVPRFRPVIPQVHFSIAPTAFRNGPAHPLPAELPKRIPEIDPLRKGSRGSSRSPPGAPQSQRVLQPSLHRTQETPAAAPRRRNSS